MNYMLNISFLLLQLCCINNFNQNSSIESKLGDIGLFCDNINECKLVINDKPTNRSITNLDLKDSIIHHWIQDDFELYLLAQSHGDGCPSMFYLIKLEHHQQFKISDDFGNCNEFDSKQLTQDSLIVDFRDNSIDSRLPVTYKFNTKDLFKTQIMR